MAKTAKRPIPVHALGDERLHLALPYRGRLKQGRLNTLCGLQAVSELPLFAMAEKGKRCKTCFAKIDEDGFLVETAPSRATPPRAGRRPALKVVTGGRKAR
jgi:hypothetical protein